ncbi:hypothetical protein VCUG_01580 [Vavraia culicis subsp. floridensis]|uniref:Uncharacterized protein n=1 Tax=Vavraia culicis (isolate floridensis) TaxID=948595 RepID=L2GTH5_VAVCU|nr:uncharacterized protein VCUG_01580 [Vavraia culicis subsp. floridensis]ELA46961.1 hypothetical protein VCUG_01580 [Vavraia culicis subsp. floridensis]
MNDMCNRVFKSCPRKETGICSLIGKSADSIDVFTGSNSDKSYSQNFTIRYDEVLKCFRMHNVETSPLFPECAEQVVDVFCLLFWLFLIGLLVYFLLFEKNRAFLFSVPYNVYYLCKKAVCGHTHKHKRKKQRQSVKQQNDERNKEYVEMAVKESHRTKNIPKDTIVTLNDLD